MQIFNMYSIRDSKGENYNPPFLKRTHGEAERDFTRLANEKQEVKDFPEDYDLYFLGTFNDQKGLVEPLSTPQHIIKAVNVIKQ